MGDAKEGAKAVVGRVGNAGEFEKEPTISSKYVVDPNHI